ncbi:MAG: hypothetical protein ABI681_05250 [Gemmatimonadales bacterium]
MKVVRILFTRTGIIADVYFKRLATESPGFRGLWGHGIDEIQLT